MMLTPEQLAELRVRFEEWELSRLHEPSSYDKFMYLAREGDGYSRNGVHCDWLAWQAASFAQQARIAELSEWETLRDPHVLHVNLLRGIPAKLSADQLLHIAGEKYQAMAARIDELEEQRDHLLQRTQRAERALHRGGFTYTEGAAEWKPPLGPSASPLLERITELEALSDDLLKTLNFERGQRVELEKDAARYVAVRSELIGVRNDKKEGAVEKSIIAAVRRTHAERGQDPTAAEIDAAIDAAMQPTWPEDTSDYGSRIAAIGQNGNDGLHYDREQEGGKDASA